jgi:hypothetical protein
MVRGGGELGQWGSEQLGQSRGAESLLLHQLLKKAFLYGDLHSTSRVAIRESQYSNSCSVIQVFSHVTSPSPSLSLSLSKVLGISST